MQMPFTLRLVYHGCVAALRAGLLLLCAWIIFIPANSDEQRALGAVQETAYPAGLRQMRGARVVLAVAPQPAYTLAAAIIGPEVSPLMLQVALVAVASGYAGPARAAAAQTPQQDTARRDIDGPRFIQVD